MKWLTFVEAGTVTHSNMRIVIGLESAICAVLCYGGSNNNVGVGSAGDTGNEIFNSQIALVHNSSCQVVMI